MFGHKGEKDKYAFFLTNICNCIKQVLPCLVYYPIAFHECTSRTSRREGCYGEFQTGLLQHL